MTAISHKLMAGLRACGFGTDDEGLQSSADIDIDRLCLLCVDMRSEKMSKVDQWTLLGALWFADLLLETQPATVEAVATVETETPPRRGRRFVPPAPGIVTQPSHIGHEALDIANAPGTTIRAAMDGVVIKVGTDSAGGKFVILDHGDGLQTRYWHFEKISVHTGQRVYAGDGLGKMGSTGRSTGPHLHFEIMQDGESVL